MNHSAEHNTTKYVAVQHLHAWFVWICIRKLIAHGRKHLLPIIMTWHNFYLIHWTKMLILTVPSSSRGAWNDECCSIFQLRPHKHTSYEHLEYNMRIHSRHTPSNQTTYELLVRGVEIYTPTPSLWEISPKATRLVHNGELDDGCIRQEASGPVRKHNPVCNQSSSWHNLVLYPGHKSPEEWVVSLFIVNPNRQ